MTKLSDECVLPQIARQSIAHGLAHAKPLEPDLDLYGGHLTEPGAVFVTLKIDGKLRGCVGSIEPQLPLICDVSHNAYAAAFSDSRFHSLDTGELDRLRVSISILGPLSPISIATEKDLLDQLTPGRDGLVLTEGTNRALFLPQVWEMLPKPADFVKHLKLKAGLGETKWPKTMVAHRFEVRTAGDPET